MNAQLFAGMADLALVLHLAYIGWVIFGALLTRGRPRLAWVHVATLVYGILVEVSAWPCPLTLAENWFESRAGVEPYRGPFLLHYLDAIVYPNVPLTLLVACAVAVCLFNLGIYVRRFRRHASLG